MASSLFSILLLASIMLTFVCHIEAASSLLNARAAAKKAISLFQGAAAVAENYGATDDGFCHEGYDDAFRLLKPCLEKLKDPWNAGNKPYIQGQGADAMKDIVVCQDAWPKGMPDDLRQATDNAHNALTSFLAIVNGL